MKRSENDLIRRPSTGFVVTHARAPMHYEHCVLTAPNSYVTLTLFENNCTHHLSKKE